MMHRLLPSHTGCQQLLDKTVKERFLPPPEEQKGEKALTGFCEHGASRPVKCALFHFYRAQNSFPTRRQDAGEPGCLYLHQHPLVHDDSSLLSALSPSQDPVLK